MEGQLNHRLPGTLLILYNLLGLNLAAVDFVPISADPPFKEKTLLWCPFEEECDKMKAESDADSFDWRRHQGPTPTWDTGPAKDHTTDSPKGYMLYTEASDGMPNDTDVYKSEPLTPSVEGGCLSFWYHLRGVHIGTISAMMNGVQIWHRTGNLDKNWYRAVVPLNTRPGEQFQVSFRAVRGFGEKGDIAMDDIHVVDASCPQLFEGPNLLKCDFEKVCPDLAVQKNSGNYGWQRRQASTPTPETGPTGDHTHMDQTGHFIYAESSSAKIGDRAWIRTQPPLRQSAEAACLKFWYHMYGQGMGTLNVYMKSDDQVNERKVYSKKYNQGNMWHQAQVDLATSVNTDFYIQFEAIAGSGETSDIALDDIEIKTDKCETSTPPASSWSAWSQWSSCSQTCGDSIRTQERQCSGTICSGEDQKSERCNLGPCPELTWGEWTQWTQCSATCGEATRTRVRSCSGGQGMCGREGEQTDACPFRACPQIQPPGAPPPPSQATPEWDNWTAWTSCSVTCGDGTKSRVRECKKGSCVGNKEETVFCQEPACPAIRVTPTWNAWNPWGPCSATCGSAEKIRSRTCSGNGCPGSSSDRGMCRVPACPQTRYGPPTPAPPTTSASLAKWSDWGNCDVTCGSGYKKRTRICLKGECQGNLFEAAGCVTGLLCRKNRQVGVGTYGEWGAWSQCDATCGYGTNFRTRMCQGGNCIGGNSESRRCILTACQGCNLQLDLAIIVDSSGSIEDKGIGNWEIIKTFVNDLIQVIQVGPEATRVAVIKFSNGARVWFNLDRYKNQDDMFNAVFNMPYSGGETNTQLAINTMRTDVFRLSEGDRPDIPNACIIITDGESNIRETNTIPEANRAKQEGVNILTVGVTDEVNQREVEGMASKLDWVFRVNDFSRLYTILEGLMTQVCTVGKEDIVSSWEAWGLCSRTCGLGVMTRYRRCVEGNCRSSLTETRTCQIALCTPGSVCPGVADVCFIIDSSGSIEQKEKGNWKFVTQFLSSFVSQLDVGLQDTRVAAVQFATTAEVVFHLNTYDRKSSIVQAIENLVYWSGGTNTALALRTMRETVFTQAHGDRPNINNVGVIITDGNSIPNTSATIPEAELAKSMGIRMIAIGVTKDVNMTELRGMASKPDWVFQVDGFDRLKEVEDTIVQATCKSVEGKWNAWGEWCDCSVSCGPGIVSRKRTCQTTSCQGTNRETKTCYEAACFTQAQWGPWTGWCPCTVTCGLGAQVRSRECRGSGCIGISRESRSCQDLPCEQPVVSWGPWNSWTRCSASCGRGTRTRSRTCSGQGCPGNYFETEPCDSGACPGTWTLWTAWTRCNPTCGRGSQRRSRTCTHENCVGADTELRVCVQPICQGAWSNWGSWGTCACPQGVLQRSRQCIGAAACSGNRIMTRSCTCEGPVDGFWGAWQPWSACSVSCGGGRRSRFRTCQGSGHCPGISVEGATCNTNPCQPVSQWSAWGSWGSCSVTCGNGQERATRYCTGGSNCPGESAMTRACIRTPCVPAPQRSVWSNWGNWGFCSATCGGGIQTRRRSCLNGSNCVGNAIDYRSCNSGACTGLWGPWGFWSGCSSSCGQGTRTRTRRCVTGTDCRTGSSFQTVTCTSGPCPIVDVWGPWGPWTMCSPTCGPGTQARTRTCSQGQCFGQSETENKSCYLRECQVARWSDWSGWSQCSASCDRGQQTRQRRCLNGFNCVGSPTSSRSCNTAACIVAIWSEWSGWSQCSALCGGGEQTRQRRCLNGFNCVGSPTSSRSCNTAACIVARWSDWSGWSQCSASCGGGRQTRLRRCLNGFNCLGSSTSSRFCNAAACVVTGLWGPWGAWSGCSRSCGQGIRTRTRRCVTGTDCRTGSSLQTVMCTSGTCPIWGGWVPWSRCSVSCDSGIQTRSRLCATGNNCGNNYTDLRTCQMPACFVTGLWGPWGTWSGCSSSCGQGTRRRTRRCVTGTDCRTGSSFQTVTCTSGTCLPTTGIWTAWYSWSRCDVTCGTGRQTRTRLCPLGGCVGSYSSSRFCSAGPCPVIVGTWESFGPWSQCTRTCGGGTRSRSRRCNNVAGCGAGLNVERQLCNAHPCPVAMWLGWSHWSSCSASCGEGTHTRSRSCSSPTGCRGVGTQNEVCYMQQCTGQWSSYSGWSSCSVTCGMGIMNRVRVCTPSGASCTGGGSTQTLPCSHPSCSGGIGGGLWTQWGACSVTCSFGTRDRLCAGTGCVGVSRETCDMGPCTIAAVTGRKGAVNGIQSCGGSLSAGKDYKNLTSPGFDEESGNPVYDKCTWTISAPEGHIVLMNMVELKIDCVEEFWSLGERLGGPFELHLCGEKVKVNAASRYATRGRTAVIVYRSVPNIRRHTGFKLHYKAVPIPQTCSEDRQALSGKNGIIHSPNFHARTVYPVDNTCSWLITTQPGSIVELSFAEFDVTCDDHVIAYSGDTEDKPIKGRVCSPQNITENMFLYSTTNKMLLAFVSRGHRVGRGFIAVYRGASAGSSLALKKKASITKAPTDIIEDGLDRKFKELEHEWDNVADCGKLSRDGKIGKWHVTIRHNEKIICSGAILNLKWIVSTASCVFNRTNDRYLEARHLTVHIGLKQRSSNDTTSYVASVIGHPGFKKDTGEKDIALLKLKSALPFSSTVGPICLPGLLELETLRCKAVGFLRKDKALSTLLMDVSTRKKCLSTHPDLKLAVTEGHLCIGNGTKFNGACVGDMGSSIVCDNYGRFHLQALSLWGGADCINRPPVYLNVGTYREWLKMYILQ